MATIELETIIETDDVDDLLNRLGSRRRVLAALGDVLDESARLGAQSAQIYAPAGPTLKLKRHITAQTASHDSAGGLEARAGIEAMPGEKDPSRGAYPDVGTGLYGERNDWIRPRTGRFMVFEIGGRVVVATRVKGQKPQHFIRDAYRDVLEYLPPRLDMMARELAER